MGARTSLPVAPRSAPTQSAPPAAPPASLCEGAAFCMQLQGLTKQEWGRRCWHKLHLRAIRWHRHAMPQQVLAEHRALQSIFAHLPCEECSVHAYKHYWQVLPDLTTNASYHMWMFSFHNAVNERLGKPVLGYEEYQGLYSTELLRNGLI